MTREAQVDVISRNQNVEALKAECRQQIKATQEKQLLVQADVICYHLVKDWWKFSLFFTALWSWFLPPGAEKVNEEMIFFIQKPIFSHAEATVTEEIFLLCVPPLFQSNNIPLSLIFHLVFSLSTSANVSLSSTDRNQSQAAEIPWTPATSCRLWLGA